jgi:DNA-directed RNA polymerase specialized sigma24 family protein
MSDAVNTARLDPVLIAFVHSKSDCEQAELDQVLSTHAVPLAKKIIRHNFASLSPSDREDEEDLSSEVITRLLTRLWNLKEDPTAESIQNLEDYVAVVTHNVWNTYLRRKFPERFRIKNRIRYVLTTFPDFAIWKNVRASWYCGMSPWKGSIPTRDLETIEKLKENSALLRSISKIKDPTESGLPDLLKQIFIASGHPLDVNDLATFIFTVSGCSEHKVETEIGSEGSPVLAIVPDQKQSTLQTLESRSFLQKIWEEIRQLPQLQRIALLLHLRDEEGNDVVSLLHSSRIATLRQIAAEIGMEPEQFAAMWNDLPLDDHRIASHLSMTRQQIINLRKSARERLARKIKLIYATR